MTKIVCAYCAAQSNSGDPTWTRVPEADGPPRGLPAEWPCCQACASADVPRQMRVRRRWDNHVLRAFTFLNWMTDDEWSRAASSLNPGNRDDVLWCVDDLVKRGALVRAGDTYRDPRSFWRRLAWRWRLWRTERRSK